jgi:poly-gamma-glutamate synthesis protein (capsule biosynthesis protein)
MKPARKIIILFVLTAVLTGCLTQAPATEPAGVTTTTIKTQIPQRNPSATPFQPEPTPTESPRTYQDFLFYIDPATPEMLRGQLPAGMNQTDQPELADLSLIPSAEVSQGVDWIYAVVGPFPMITDQLSWNDLLGRWEGLSAEWGPVLVSKPTFLAMKTIFGEPDGDSVEVVTADRLVDRLWELQRAIAIVPFEELEPRLKVLSFEGQSPISNQFDPEAYPLRVRFCWQGSADALELQQAALERGEAVHLVSNRDPGRLTVLVMTGVTALVRATAARMEQMGMTYPGRDIRDWLVSADLTHISNEVSFTPTCPNPNPNQYELIFCSKPEYIELLDDVGTDILDLTGNHGIDWGREALAYSLDLYRQRGWTVFAAGENLAAARAAATIEHNGNRFAFIGCNPAGPPYIWAAENLSGVANCDYPWMWAEIRRLRDEGYIVIMTFQYFETYRATVETFEMRDFRSMVDAGAVIVSGSQAHHPMAMEFYGGSFIHYGLGNLFFDQMFNETYPIQQGTRKEFIDRHVFYNGRHISTELLTAFLEDFARPRPMSEEERRAFLAEIFAAGEWAPGEDWSFSLE